MRFSLTSLAIALFTLASTPSHARLGETEAQNQARYGPAAADLIGANEKPLVPGVNDVACKFQGWRLRVAFLNGVAARIEYAQLPEGTACKQITDAQVKTILEAESNKLHWREQKPAKTGDIGKDIGAAIASAVGGKAWERSDHATAALKSGNIVLLVELPAVAAHEKTMGKSPGAAGPKF